MSEEDRVFRIPDDVWERATARAAERGESLSDVVARKLQNYGLGHGEVTHGLVSTYGRGCRCEECTRANTRNTVKKRKRTNAATRDGAHKHGGEWTGPELEVALRADLTARAAGAMLGRTMQAVKNARIRARTDPRYARKVDSPEQS